jgi:hypothetical protein
MIFGSFEGSLTATCLLQWADRSAEDSSSVGFSSFAAPTGLAGSLESFGRRRRTKVLEERTRGVQASVYGDLGSWLMQDSAQ